MNVKTGHRQILRAKFWIRPSDPNMSIETLAQREEARGNNVIEIHKDCSCIGAVGNDGDNTIDGLNGPNQDDHLLVVDAEKVL